MPYPYIGQCLFISLVLILVQILIRTTALHSYLSFLDMTRVLKKAACMTVVIYCSLCPPVHSELLIIRSSIVICCFGVLKQGEAEN